MHRTRTVSLIPPGIRASGVAALGTVALAAALVLAATVPAPAQEAETLVYYSFDRAIPIAIAPDRIGLVTEPGVDPQSLRQELRKLDLKLAETHPGGIHVISAPGVREGERFEILRKDLRALLGERVLRIGLVVRHLEGQGAPMVLGDDLVVQFRSEVGPEEVKALAEELGLRVSMENPFAKGQYLLQLPSGPGAEVVEIARRLHEDERTEYAHPNFSRPVIDRQTVPNDRLFGNQWHLDNTGQGGGTADADVDAPLAFDFTLGDAGTVIAVIDSGFDAAHPDLTPNLWTNPGEVPGNGADDDGNSLVDDVNGWDFSGCSAMTAPGCGDADVSGGNHGTAVAGAAAARGDNARGVSGACPRCSLMLVRRGGTDFDQGMALGYAAQMGAEVSTNSWGYGIGTPCATSVCTAINNAVAGGQTVLFAMNTTSIGYREDCLGANPDISSLPGVIAVAASNNRDERTPSGYGDCMEVLGPTDSIDSALGTLWAVTTDRVGAAGYNNASTTMACPTAEPGPPPADARDYTVCFGGTSFATPVTAGVAGLVLSARPATTRLELQRLLQDTADKVEHSAGAYDPDTGFSQPAAAPTAGLPVGSTHGWGRVNAFEAVRVMAPVADGGKSGTDVFLRDNRLDWGNTEQPSNVLMEPARGFIAHWRSPDIKVDHPPYQPAPMTSADFDAFVDEDPQADGTLNRVYVRVRNRGPTPAETVPVKLHWAFAGTALPALPADFWATFPGDSADTTVWHPLGVQNAVDLAYSGASVAGCPGRATPPCGGAADAAQILAYDFPGPPLDLTRANPRHYCLLAVLQAPDDPVSPAAMGSLVPDWITPRDNNVTHRNVRLADSTRSGRFEERFFVRNPTRARGAFVLNLDVPEGWEATLEPFPAGQTFTLEPGQEVLATLEVAAPRQGAWGTVRVTQRAVRSEVPFRGGLVFEYAPRRDEPSEPPGQALPDLTVTLDGPQRARPGDDLEGLVKVVARNVGRAPGAGTLDVEDGGWMVDLVLSGDDRLPVRFATFSPTFEEDVLLRAGRFSRTRTLAPGEERLLSEGGAVLPERIPPGTYCLGAVIDPGRAVEESDETNNTDCHPIRIE